MSLSRAQQVKTDLKVGDYQVDKWVSRASGEAVSLIVTTKYIDYADKGEDPVGWIELIPENIPDLERLIEELKTIKS